ncbi:MAG: response regulator [Candidatus Nomurabacteria bacterium]|jgi:CheY-like chemotaxis protein|nr:response regulator [Candidatus Nomurabacteria bacterium]
MIIDDDKGWLDYYRNLLKNFDIELFRDGVAAIQRMDKEVPKLILLDILLTGPTGFSILSEMQSYPELANIPIFVVSSVDLSATSLQKYGVKEIFNKSTMLPQNLLARVREYLNA